VADRRRRDARCRALFGVLYVAALLSLRTVYADGLEPLLSALKARDFDAVAALVRDGVDVNATFDDGKTALWCSARRAGRNWCKRC
jgi:ankyrin repeat protein